MTKLCSEVPSAGWKPFWASKEINPFALAQFVTLLATTALSTRCNTGSRAIGRQLARRSLSPSL
ncbi:hypothetical protein T07_3809 [Trichinella nelsoni]|uniref:Uncharacterized protein n=1 Tax=Trichinella nelsoni TaxID=6336 RepID=A0A0V0RD28_9BILA|nr:hypothetical protein T07_3809 [Trichinella nelsoni]